MTGLLLALLAATAAAPAQRVSAPAPQSGAEVPAIVGLPYAAARSRLIRAGWRPAENVIDPTNPDLASGNGPVFVARGYRELVSCSGTGRAYCRFAYRRAGRLLSVVTAGEEPGARVHSFRLERGDRD